MLDASAILAVINAEPGSGNLTVPLLSRAIASSVNLAEVQTKLLSRGWEPEQAWEDALSPVREVVPSISGRRGLQETWQCKRVT